MTNPEPQQNQGDGTTNGETPNGVQPQSWPIKVAMYLFIVPVVLWWESTKGLMKRTYSDAGSNDLNVLNVVIGVVVSLLAGIGLGYQLGWVSEPPATLVTWLSAGVGAAVATFVYGWTALHFVVFRHAMRLSEKLWRHVNLDGDEPYRRSENQPNNPAWFSRVLIVLGVVGVVALTALSFWEVTTYVQAHQSGWGWLGAIVAVVACILAAVVAIAILGFAAEISGKLAFFLLLILGVVAWWNWGFVSGVATGLYGNLTGSDWGNWGYVVGGLVGIIAGAITAGISGTLLSQLKVRIIAVATSAAATYALIPWTAQTVAGVDLGAFSVAAPALPWVASALEFFLIIGYAFPLAHIVISHGLKRLANVLDLMDSVYGEKTGGYREFFLSVLTLAATVAAAWFGPSLAVAYGGFESAWLIYGATAVGTLLVYTLGGKLILRIGTWPLGVAAAGYAGLEAYTYYIAGAYPFGWVGGAAAGVASGVVTFVVGFPLVYLAVRCATQSWLGAALREPLLNMHKRVSKGIVDLVDELFSAARHTYNDNTPYRDTFLQLANLVASAGITYGAWIGSAYFGFALWLSVLATVVTAVASYTIVGQVFKTQGNGLVGFLVAVVGGIFAGIMVHGAQPYGFWLSIPGGVLGAALTAGAVFPWAYLLLRAVLNVVAQEQWLRPALVNTHEAVWSRFANLRRDFLVTYRQVRDSINKLKDDFYRSYEQIRSQIFGGKK